MEMVQPGDGVVVWTPDSGGQRFNRMFPPSFQEDELLIAKNNIFVNKLEVSIEAA